MVLPDMRLSTYLFCLVVPFAVPVGVAIIIFVLVMTYLVVYRRYFCRFCFGVKVYLSSSLVLNLLMGGKWDELKDVVEGKFWGC